MESLPLQGMALEGCCTVLLKCGMDVRDHISMLQSFRSKQNRPQARFPGGLYKLSGTGRLAAQLANESSFECYAELKYLTR